MRYVIPVLLLSALPAVAQDFNYSSSYGQLRCSDSQREDSFGRSFEPSLEFYGEVNTATDEATVGFNYKIPLGKKPVRLPSVNRCAWADRDAQVASSLDRQKQALELERMRLELELLRRQVEAEPVKPPEKEMIPWPTNQ